jgi:steroid delta-isomerase-like uncharacterized protein
VATSSIRSDPPNPCNKDLRDTDLHEHDSYDKLAARIAIVEKHVRLENEHDFEGVLGTFGDTARYDDDPWDEHFNGRDGVRQFYEQMMKVLPDLQIEIQRRHVTDDAIILEVIIRGTQLGAWRGLPATGKRVELPLCGIYTFDADNRLAGEKSPAHSHRWPSVLYILTAGDFIDRDGEGKGNFDSRELKTPLQYPMTMWKDPEAPHAVEI